MLFEYIYINIYTYIFSIKKRRVPPEQNSSRKSINGSTISENNQFVESPVSNKSLVNDQCFDENIPNGNHFLIFS